MQFANNENGKRIFIGEASEDNHYFCPYCDAPMIQRRGQVNVPHFAHAKGCLCSDNWRYEEMSEWHLTWQGKFPLECREVPVVNEFGRHRADVLINETVVEFQHSPMSPEEFQERNNFYLACGYRVVWVFDALEQYKAGLLFNDEEEGDLYYWKHAPKTTKNFDVHGLVQVYFHVQDKHAGDGDAVMRLTWCNDGDLSYFKSSSRTCYTEDELVRLVTQGSAQRTVDDLIKRELFHNLYIVRRKEDDVNEACGCPVNEDGYAPDVSSNDDRQGCNNCPFARVMGEFNPGVRRCAGRFRGFLDQIETVLDLKRIDEQIYGVTYVDRHGQILEQSVDIPESPASTIPELWRDYGAGVMCVRNIKTGKFFKICANPFDTLAKYGRIYGFIYKESWGHYSNKSDVIYFACKPEWVVSWYKTEEQRRAYRG